MKLDKSATNFAPLPGASADSHADLYPLVDELKRSHIPVVIVKLQVHADSEFAAAWSKAANRYRKNVPTKGVRMKRLVAQAIKRQNQSHPS